ncbi:MAG: hypothetical protein HC836_43755 [Richelia sp. RM2_1_2]|nr:hypothetical protein [Richelia sp. RM2_1_2]
MGLYNSHFAKSHSICPNCATTHKLHYYPSTYDFVVGKDYLGLADGLSFEQLAITQGSDTNADNTLISIADNQVIATLIGVQADMLGFWDFNMM